MWDSFFLCLSSNTSKVLSAFQKNKIKREGKKALKKSRFCLSLSLSLERERERAPKKSSAVFVCVCVCVPTKRRHNAMTTGREEEEEKKTRRTRRKVKRWETYSSVEWTTVEMFFDDCDDDEVVGVREDQVTCDVVTSSSSSSKKKVLEVRLLDGKVGEKGGGGGDLALAVDVGEDVDGEDVRVRCGKKKIEVKLKRRRLSGKKEKTMKSENHRVEKNASLVDEKSSAQMKTDFEKEKATDAGFKSDDKWTRLEYVAEMEEEVETLDGDDGLNKMFQDLYRDADDDQRRAMMKSFVESNGTVLSTDWADVGEKFVEPQAP